TDPAWQGFLIDDLTCDLNAVSGANGGACSGPAGGAGNTVDYALADIPLTTPQLQTWTGGTLGEKVAGHLLQIPSAGTGVAIAVVNPAV
ncbi:hypothetical protein ACSTG3_23685, partial [Vibrio parahaemolyticus]